MGDEHIEEARRPFFKNVSMRRREKQPVERAESSVTGPY